MFVIAEGPFTHAAAEPAALLRGRSAREVDATPCGGPDAPFASNA